MDTPINSAFARALSRVLHDGRFTVIELAEVADCSERHIRKVANQKASLGSDKAELVCRYLCRHNETRPSDAFSCAGWRNRKDTEGEVTGSVDDDMAEIMRGLGHLKDHQDQLDAEAGRKALRTIRKELRDIEAEIEEWE